MQSDSSNSLLTSQDYIYFPNYIQISSQDRDTTAYPSVNKYCIRFSSELKNIVSIQLASAVIPTITTGEPLLILKINELDSNIQSNSNSYKNSLTQLQLTDGNANGFINVDLKLSDRIIQCYKTPIASLSKLTISILDINGNLYNFGTDSSPPLKSLQNHFIFKIVTREKNMNRLGVQNV
jgi:hypothetical protein